MGVVLDLKRFRSVNLSLCSVIEVYMAIGSGLKTDKGILQL